MRVVIVGGGIAGLAAAHRLSQGTGEDGSPLEVTVVESREIAGGHAQTIKEEGFLIEAGPNGFLYREGESRTVDLATELGIDSTLIEARHESSRRFIVHGGRLRRVPDSPAALLFSDALSMRGKLRLLLEPWSARAPEQEEETVYQFACRRIGDEAAEVLVDTAVSGISSGDSRTLSVEAAFPRMIEMERDHGSLIRAMISGRRGRPRPKLMSFAGGMSTLTASLQSKSGARLRSGETVTRVRRTGTQWRLDLERGGCISADRVVLALPARCAAPLLEEFDGSLSRILSTIQPTRLAVVAMAFRKSDFSRPFVGYGYLVARSEEMATLGVLWESTIFKGRAPEDSVLLRVMMGGARHPKVADLPEAELVDVARTELERVIGIAVPPRKTWVIRWHQGIAQYTLGHGKRIRVARELAGRHPGLELCGSSYDGIAFDAAVGSGRDAADRLLGVSRAAIVGAQDPMTAPSDLAPAQESLS